LQGVRCSYLSALIADMPGQAPAERAPSPSSVSPVGVPRRTSGRVVRLPLYDIRLRRELAHRRMVISVIRQSVRLATLHALDAMAILFAYALAARIVHPSSSASAIPALVAFVLVGLNVRGNYRAGAGRRDTERLITGIGVGLILLAIPASLPGSFVVSREFVTVFGLSCIAALILERQAVDAVIRQVYVRGYWLRRALLIARTHEVKELRAALVPTPTAHNTIDDQVIVGFVSPEPFTDPESLGPLDTLPQLLEDKDISEVLVGTSVRGDLLAEVTDVCFERGVRVLVVPSVPHSLGGWAELTHVGRLPAYQLHPARLELPALILKRATDLILATLGVIIAAPFMLLIAVFIKTEAPGPVFFRQRRVGLGGREFMMWKFRSMYHEAESRQHEIAHLNPYEDNRLFKLPRDPRITRVGRVLRRLSLDELPQLFNVLAGDMSLVGPRPPLPSEVKRYESRHYIRLSVVPGLTGPWQVNGRNLITDFEEVVRLERNYIENWSLRSDIEIMVRTIGVVLSGRGAY
jgi:exopolysaccharide biosynthesis polyprenyl glycosylphosphotransferase